MNDYFNTDYQQLIYTSRYARWIEEKGRREYWPETVDRYVSFMVEHVEETTGYKIPKHLKDEVRNAILNFEVLPSMRALMTAGKALKRDNTAGYNCSYLPVDDMKAFDEAMFILMCGTGVGYSVETKYVTQLPEVPDVLFESDTTIIVKDSKEGWAKAYRQLIALLYSGEIPKWDTSRLRAAGSRLKTFGGRASGPAPLEDLFRFTVEVFRASQGRKLTQIECHDIMCKVGEIVVVGGVRRSAMISLSDMEDSLMRSAKSGPWYIPLNDKDSPVPMSERHPYRALANNSAVYNGRPTMEEFMREWLALMESKSGERGIFNRKASKQQAGKSGRRDTGYLFGTNPCSEIILRPNQFCNLTEVVIRATDDLESLKRKVRVASILGTFQSTLTNFPYLRKIWQKNTEEERLLGVSLTGIMDNKLTNGATGFNGLGVVLSELKRVAVDTNELYARRLNIQRSAAITCVKPSGTVSQLVNSASGIHTRYAPFYIRTVRADNKDPLTQFLKDGGIPWEPDVTKPDSTSIFSFPIKAPEGSVTRKDMSALDMLDIWMVYQDKWCEHKPSVTIDVRDDEWMAVGAFVYENFNEISGVSFLPYSDHIYKQAPYQEIDEDKYHELLSQMPKGIDWTVLSMYEKEDTTTGSQELACGGGACEIVDLNKSN